MFFLLGVPVNFSSRVERESVLSLLLSQEKVLVLLFLLSYFVWTLRVLLLSDGFQSS